MDATSAAHVEQRVRVRTIKVQILKRRCVANCSSAKETNAIKDDERLVHKLQSVDVANTP
jgi:hypothetical protein